jgi:hypothetical protein
VIGTVVIVTAPTFLVTRASLIRAPVVVGAASAVLVKKVAATASTDASFIYCMVDEEGLKMRMKRLVYDEDFETVDLWKLMRTLNPPFIIGSLLDTRECSGYYFQCNSFKC